MSNKTNLDLIKEIHLNELQKEREKLALWGITDRAQDIKREFDKLYSMGVRDTLSQFQRERDLFDLVGGRQLLSYDVLKLQRERIESIQKSAASALADAMRPANLSVLNIIEGLRGKSDALAEIRNLSKGWRDQINNHSDRAFEAILGDHFGRISSVSVLAQSTLAGLRSEQIGSVLKMAASMDVKKTLAADLVGLSLSYKGLFESYEQSQTNFLSLPPQLVELPAIEFFNGTDLLWSTSTEGSEDEGEYADEKASVREEIQLETSDALEKLLYDFRPELIQLRQGARLALSSENPDRVRHFITSYRELFTHILHDLSPDNEVRTWSTAKEHFSKDDRPTRKARLLFICRNVNQKPFNVFVEKDIEAALAAIDLFNRGTHEVSSLYSPAQLKALEVRMESTLRFLLEIKQTENN